MPEAKTFADFRRLILIFEIYLWVEKSLYQYGFIHLLKVP